MVYLTETMHDHMSGKSVIFEFIRTEDGKKVINKITDFQPYFFIEESTNINDYRIIKEESGFTGLGNVKLKKCILKDTKDIKDIKDELHNQGIKTYEADIPFNNRYMIDKVININSVPLKVFSIDIETNYENIPPNMDDPDQEITCIGLMDSFSDKKYVFIWREDFNTDEYMIDDTIVLKYNTEESMLKAFADFIHDEEPDIITGWNVDKFDMYYIIGRMQVLDIDFRRLSPIRSVRLDNRYQDVSIKGIVIFDLLKYYKYFRKISNQTELINYKLDTVGEEIISINKLKYNNSLRWLWKNDADTLIRYNIRDVELVMDIDRKLRVIDFFDTLRIMAKCQFEDIMKTTVMLDCYMMSTYHDIKLPSKVKHDDNKFQGAFVGSPLPGLYKNTICLDVKSMYPSIMKTFNISPETFNPINGEIRISDEVAFDREKGMIPKILEDLGAKRQHYKDNKNTATKKSAKWNVAHYRQYGIKVLMNSFYGYLGAPSSRLYIKEIAETITSMGRNIILWTNNIVEKNKYIILYNDTDSSYVGGLDKIKNPLEVIKIGNWLLNIVNKSYDELIKQYNVEKHCIEMEFEKALKVILFTYGKDGKGAKKTYAYKKLWEDGKFIHNDSIHLSGFGAKRSDNAAIAKRIQKEVLHRILEEQSQEEIFEYLLEEKNKILNKEIELEELAFPIAFKGKLNEYGQVTSGLKGAFYANRYLGANLEQGGKYLWLPIIRAPQGMPQYIKIPFIKTNPYNGEKEKTKMMYPINAITFDEYLPDNFKDVINYDYLDDRIFKMKLENIFKAVGWEWKKIEKQKQTTLF